MKLWIRKDRLKRLKLVLYRLAKISNKCKKLNGIKAQVKDNF